MDKWKRVLKFRMFCGAVLGLFVSLGCLWYEYKRSLIVYSEYPSITEVPWAFTELGTSVPITLMFVLAGAFLGLFYHNISENM